MTASGTTAEHKALGDKFTKPGEWAVRTQLYDEIAKCTDLNFCITVANSLVSARWTPWATVEDWDTLHGPEVQYVVGNRTIYDSDMEGYGRQGYPEVRATDCIDKLKPGRPRGGHMQANGKQ